MQSISDKLKANLSWNKAKSADGLTQQMSGGVKKLLLYKNEFVAASQPASSFIDILRNKYPPLIPNNCNKQRANFRSPSSMTSANSSLYKFAQTSSNRHDTSNSTSSSSSANSDNFSPTSSFSSPPASSTVRLPDAPCNGTGTPAAAAAVAFPSPSTSATASSSTFSSAAGSPAVVNRHEKLVPNLKPLHISTPTSKTRVYPTGATSVSGAPAAAAITSPTLTSPARPKTVLCQPEKIQMFWPRHMRIGAGLLNLGNTCFLNSTLQCLTYTPPLALYLLKYDHRHQCAGAFCLLCELANHIQSVQQTREPMRPLGIIRKLTLIAKHMQFGRQEDAHEFLRYVIDGLQKACLIGFPPKLEDTTKETTMVHQIFGGYIRSQVTCSKCHEPSNKFDPILDICIDLKGGVNSLVEALYKYIQPDRLDSENAYKCKGCGFQPALKQMTIFKPPKVMTFQLKRFDYRRLFGSKVTKHIQFSERLNIRPFLSQSTGEPVIYQLYAVLVHEGMSCNSGHYYSYVRNSDKVWYIMNDAHVRPVGVPQVLAAQAYLLFYSRITPVIPTHLSLTGAALSTALVQNKHVTVATSTAGLTSPVSSTSQQRPSQQSCRISVSSSGGPVPPPTSTVSSPSVGPQQRPATISSNSSTIPPGGGGVIFSNSPSLLKKTANLSGGGNKGGGGSTSQVSDKVANQIKNIFASERKSQIKFTTTKILASSNPDLADKCSSDIIKSPPPTFSSLAQSATTVSNASSNKSKGSSMSSSSLKPSLFDSLANDAAAASPRSSSIPPATTVSSTSPGGGTRRVILSRPISSDDGGYESHKGGSEHIKSPKRIAAVLKSPTTASGQSKPFGFTNFKPRAVQVNPTGEQNEKGPSERNRNQTAKCDDVVMDQAKKSNIFANLQRDQLKEAVARKKGAKSDEKNLYSSSGASSSSSPTNLIFSSSALKLGRLDASPLLAAAAATTNAGRKKFVVVGSPSLSAQHATAAASATATLSSLPQGVSLLPVNATDDEKQERAASRLVPAYMSSSSSSPCSPSPPSSPPPASSKRRVRSRRRSPSASPPPVSSTSSQHRHLHTKTDDLEDSDGRKRKGKKKEKVRESDDDSSSSSQNKEKRKRPIPVSRHNSFNDNIPKSKRLKRDKGGEEVNGFMKKKKEKAYNLRRGGLRDELSDSDNGDIVVKTKKKAHSSGGSRSRSISGSIKAASFDVRSKDSSESSIERPRDASSHWKQKQTLSSHDSSSAGLNSNSRSQHHGSENIEKRTDDSRTGSRNERHEGYHHKVHHSRESPPPHPRSSSSDRRKGTDLVRHYHRSRSRSPFDKKIRKKTDSGSSGGRDIVSSVSPTKRKLKHQWRPSRESSKSLHVSRPIESKRDEHSPHCSPRSSSAEKRIPKVKCSLRNEKKNRKSSKTERRSESADSSSESDEEIIKKSPKKLSNQEVAVCDRKSGHTVTVVGGSGAGGSDKTKKKKNLQNGHQRHEKEINQKKQDFSSSSLSSTSGSSSSSSSSESDDEEPTQKKRPNKSLQQQPREDIGSHIVNERHVTRTNGHQDYSVARNRNLEDDLLTRRKSKPNGKVVVSTVRPSASDTTNFSVSPQKTKAHKTNMKEPMDRQDLDGKKPSSEDDDHNCDDQKQHRRNRHRHHKDRNDHQVTNSSEHLTAGRHNGHHRHRTESPSKKPHSSRGTYTATGGDGETLKKPRRDKIVHQPQSNKLNGGDDHHRHHHKQSSATSSTPSTFGGGLTNGGGANNSSHPSSYKFLPASRINVALELEKMSSFNGYGGLVTTWDDDKKGREANTETDAAAERRWKYKSSSWRQVDSDSRDDYDEELDHGHQRRTKKNKYSKSNGRTSASAAWSNSSTTNGNCSNKFQDYQNFRNAERLHY